MKHLIHLLLLLALIVFGTVSMVDNATADPEKPCTTCK